LNVVVSGGSYPDSGLGCTAGKIGYAMPEARRHFASVILPLLRMVPW
jgi:hypothetical protein